MSARRLTVAVLCAAARLASRSVEQHPKCQIAAELDEPMLLAGCGEQHIAWRENGALSRAHERSTAMHDEIQLVAIVRYLIVRTGRRVEAQLDFPCIER